MFCSDRCGSAYWKVHGTTHKHKDLPHFNCKDCEQCGNQFWYNDYAQRSGKRVPKFCSTRCRVRSFRHTKDGIPFDRPYTTRETKREQPKARPFKTGDFRDTLHPPTRWTSRDAFQWIGVPWDSDKKVTQAAVRELNKRYHPDLNQGVAWPHLVHVNAAWDFLKRKFY
jgi:hypothetical protein